MSLLTVATIIAITIIFHSEFLQSSNLVFVTMLTS